MITCTCGEKFEDACSHAGHKIEMKNTRSTIEHFTVCSICLKKFSKYPIIPKEAFMATDIFNGKIIDVVHDDCRKLLETKIDFAREDDLGKTPGGQIFNAYQAYHEGLINFTEFKNALGRYIDK